MRVLLGAELGVCRVEGVEAVIADGDETPDCREVDPLAETVRCCFAVIAFAGPGIRLTTVEERCLFSADAVVNLSVEMTLSGVFEPLNWSAGAVAVAPDLPESTERRGDAIRPEDST